MPSFSFEILADDGQRRSGRRDAVSASALAQELAGQGGTILGIRPADDTSEQTSKAANGFSFQLGAAVSIDELIVFSHQVTTLVKAGISLVRAIRGLSESTSNDRFAGILGDVAGDLEAGNDLASALGKHPKTFDDLYVSVIHVGEQTGNLEQAFRQISSYLELERETIKRVKSATRYPMFVLIAISAAIVLLNVYVIPAFANVFAKYQAELPWQTQAILGVSDFFTSNGPLLFVALIAAIYGFRRYVATPGGRLRWDGLKLRIPILGSIFLRINLARFCQTFAMVLQAGLPVTQGLHVVGSAVGNEYMAARIRNMKQGIERGESISRTAKDADLFPPVVLQMIAVGEETGAVDELLSQAAGFYEEEIDFELKGLTEAIEPLLIIAIAGMVLVLALGVFLPLWDLSSVANR